MSKIAAIGEELRVAGFALAGVEVFPVEDAGEAMAAWEAIGPEVGLLLLAPGAAAALADRLPERKDLLWATLPR